MTLKKIYLDEIYLDGLEQLAIKSGWIKRTRIPNGPIDIRFESNRLSNRVMLKSKLLLMLTLFDNVDSFCSLYDWTPLVNEGIVSENAIMLARHNVADNEGSLNCERKQLLDFSRKSAYELMKLFKRQFIKHHIRTSVPWFYARHSRWTVDEKDLISGFERVLEEGDFGDKPHLASFSSDLSLMRSSLENGLYYSSLEKAAFASNFVDMKSTDNQPEIKLIDDLYYIAKTRLTDEITILPEPKSFRDVITMRKSKAISSFREAIANWCEALKEGDIVAEQKMRRDIKKANQGLTRLEHWRKYESSPLNFWLNTLGGQIPVLSYILASVAIISRLYSPRIERKHSWVMLVRKSNN